MRQKELRIALICYGGISLAVYMHGVTKELWKLTRASRAIWAGDEPQAGTEAVYVGLMNHLRDKHDLHLRVLSDIVAGASAGGINAVFLAQAIHSGHSLEPLTQLWLERADVETLLDPEARPWGKYSKFWTRPLVDFLLRRPGNAVSASVAPETREEVRSKLSQLIRSRWFEPPFGGIGFSRLLCEALTAMNRSPVEAPLLPPGHPLDLFVTATDFKGHLETLRLHSPELVQESEHRLPIGFRSMTPLEGGYDLASPLELVFAARATASFPGAFPPLQVSEIDTLAAEHGIAWPTRAAFLERILPEHVTSGEIDGVSLIDGSVLVNAPFADAMAVLRDRPAHREVDRRFVYIDPHPDRIGKEERSDTRAPGFFTTILGSLSSIPREQPVRDNLEVIAQRSKEMATLRSIVKALRPEIEQDVEKLFGRTLFFDKPTVKRLAAWRAKAQQTAWEKSGFAFHGYAQVKFNGIVNDLAETIHAATPRLKQATPELLAQHIGEHLVANGLDRVSDLRTGTSDEAVTFFREHDLSFRIRRLRLLARRLTQDWEGGEDVPEKARDAARETVYKALAIYLDLEAPAALGGDFPTIAARVFDAPAEVLRSIGERRNLMEADTAVDAILVAAMEEMEPELRRRLLLTYLGFPFYDTVTLPLLRGEGHNEFDPAKVDRISPDDAPSIRSGGTKDTLRGTEFYNFGAFFSRAYRENDYLWGRLHGVERMIDLVASTVPEDQPIEPDVLTAFKRKAFLAILAEEEERLKADPALIPRIRSEVLGKR